MSIPSTLALIKSESCISEQLYTAISEVLTDEDLQKLSSSEGKNCIVEILGSRHCKIVLGWHLDSDKKIKGLILSIVSINFLVVHKFSGSTHQVIRVQINGTSITDSPHKSLQQVFAQCVGEPHTDSIVFYIDELSDPEKFNAFFEYNQHMAPNVNIVAPKFGKYMLPVTLEGMRCEYGSRIPTSFLKQLRKICQLHKGFLKQISSQDGISFERAGKFFNARMGHQSSGDNVVSELMILIYRSNHLEAYKIGDHCEKISGGEQYTVNEYNNPLQHKYKAGDNPETFVLMRDLVDREWKALLDKYIGKSLPVTIPFDVKVKNSTELQKIIEFTKGYPFLLPDSIRALMGPIRDEALQDEKLALLDELGLLSS